MTQNFIKIYMGNDLAFDRIDNDVLVGRSHLANRIELITPLGLTDNQIIQIYFQLANGQVTPKRQMINTGSTETVDGDEWNVYRYDVPQSVLSAVSTNNSADLKVQFRQATIDDSGGSDIAVAIKNSALVQLALDAGFTPNADDEIVNIDEYEDLSNAIDLKLNKNFTALTAKATPDDTDLFAIDEGSGVNKKVTVAQVIAKAQGEFADLDSRVTTIEGRVNQGVKTTDSPTFAATTVDGKTLNSTTIGVLEDKYTQQETDDLLAGKAATSHSHTISDITDLLDNVYTETEVNNLLSNKVNTSAVGTTIATLESGKVPANQLPSFVDDVLEFANLAAFPATGETGKIYVALDTNKTYRWSGSQYTEISPSEVISVNSKTGAVTLLGSDIDIDAEDVDVVASGFTGVLTTDDIDLQTALETLDQHTHTYAEITDKPDFYTEAETDSLLAGKVDVGALAGSVTLYPTTADADISGYKKLVDSISDADYDDVAVDIATGQINADGQLVASLAADASLFIGNPGVINITTLGNIRKVGGNNNQNASFYYELYKRDSGGTETLLAQSDNTSKIQSETYEEFFASALLNNGEFIATDRIVIKYYGDVEDGAGASYEFQFGGSAPVRTLLPLPIAVLQSADKIVYDNTVSELTATNLQDAVDELDALIAQNTSVIKIQRFVITNADNGDGTFSYTYLGNARSGTLASGEYRFDLEESVSYIVGENRVEVKVNNDLNFYPADTELAEIDTDTVGLTYALQVNDEVFIKVYQGLDTVAIAVGDGTITEAKLSTALQNKVTSYDAHIIATDNPHSVTAAQVGAITQSDGDGRYAPIAHATSATTYGVATGTDYGHVRVPLADSTATGALYFSGVSVTAGALNGSTTDPTNTTRLNYEGHLYATKVYAGSSELATTTSVDAKADVDFYTTTIAAADTWTDQTGYFTLAKTVSGITATDKPVIDLDLTSATVADVADIQAAWATIYRAVTSTDTITFYALEDPTFPEDTVLQIKVVK